MKIFLILFNRILPVVTALAPNAPADVVVLNVKAGVDFKPEQE